MGCYGVGANQISIEDCAVDSAIVIITGGRRETRKNGRLDFSGCISSAT